MTSCQMVCFPKDLDKPSTTTSTPIAPPARHRFPGVRGNMKADAAAIGVTPGQRACPPEVTAEFDWWSRLNNGRGTTVGQVLRTGPAPLRQFSHAAQAAMIT
ncbi:hypothetical protein GCM10022247_21760 [Allokutzneria multivorans]|uniref:Uncharacterized protein n=1 Tax=Allokutzneria multivorans TaxID=1142134 RepID=A0ABP7RQW1_9PSEU